MLDEQDKKRADEWAAREEKIKNAMDRMADTVIKRNNNAEREDERRLLHYAQERDKKAELKEQKQKDAARKRDIDIKKTLDKQMEEQKQLRDMEKANNKKYV